MTLIRDYALAFLPIAGGIRRSKFLQVFAASNFVAKRQFVIEVRVCKRIPAAELKQLSKAGMSIW
jgi:hypothetical protein